MFQLDLTNCLILKSWDKSGIEMVLSIYYFLYLVLSQTEELGTYMHSKFEHVILS